MSVIPPSSTPIALPVAPIKATDAGLITDSLPLTSPLHSTSALISNIASTIAVTSSDPVVPSALPQTVGELWTMCLRYRQICLGAGLVIFVLASLSGIRVTPLYRSEASLEFYSPPKPVNFQTQDGSDAAVPYYDVSRINTQRERMLATPVLSRALSICDLGVGPAYRHGGEAAIATLRSRLNITVAKDNFVFTVALDDEDRMRAQRGLQAVLDAYFSEQEDRAGSRANSGLAFIERQVTTARRAADASRAEEQAFKRAHDILSTDPEENLHARTLRDLTLKRTDLGQRLASSKALVNLVQEAERGATPDLVRAGLLRIDPIGTNALVQKVQEQLFQVQAEAESLKPRFGPKHPRMKEAQLAIAARTAELDQAIDTARQNILETFQQLNLESQSLDKEILSESAALELYRADLNRLQSLTQKTKQDADILDDLMRQQREGAVLARLDAKQVIVNSPPSPASGPTNVHLLRTFAMALFFGVMTAVCAAFIAELLNRTITGVARARELSGLPMLGEVPTAGEILPPLGGADPEAHPDINAAVRAIRENLILSGQRVLGGRCLVITSPMPDEGKTSVTARLAISLAAAGAKVLLIDADMRHPSQDAQMGSSGAVGFAALLAGADAQPQATAYHHLDYLGVGEQPGNPAELLYSPVLSSWLAEARHFYDFILCDSPPLIVTDPLILSEQADGVVMVLRDRHTTKAALREAMLSLAPVRDRILGFILNDAREERARARYYYYGYTTRAASAAQPTTQRTV